MLITGSAGTIGQVLMHHWRDRRPVGLDRANADFSGDLAAGLTGLDDAFRGQDVIIHLAADPNPHAPFASAARDNIRSTLTAIEGCLLHGVPRLIYASSVWADWQPWQLAERTTWYAASKLAGEALVRAWADQTGYPATCIRPGHYNSQIEPTSFNDRTMCVDTAALCLQFDEAMAWSGPGCKVVYALGRLGS